MPNPDSREPYRWRRIAIAAGTSLATVVGAIACGSRTNLDVPTPDGTDAEQGPAPVEPSPDAGHDRDAAGRDAGAGADGGKGVIDATARDATLSDASEDADPVLETDAGAPVPPIDGSSPDGGSACPDGGDTAAYLVSLNATLYRFDPSTLRTQALGVLSCPAAGGKGPYTMAISPDGVAYVVYEDWNLYRVDLSTLACAPTPYVPGQLGWSGEFVIAISSDQPPRMYFYGFSSAGKQELAVSDLSQFILRDVGPVVPQMPISPPDIKVDPFGRLLALDLGGDLAQIDVASGAVVGQDSTAFTSAAGWALLTWNGGVYFFGHHDGTVYRYDLATKVLTVLGSVGAEIVGAAAAPCFP